jgi:hypothetical protein
VRSSLTPIETRSAEDTSRFSHVWRTHGFQIDSDSTKERHARVGDDSGVTGQLRMSFPHQSISERNTKLAGQMVVASASSPERCIARPNNESL